VISEPSSDQCLIRVYGNSAFSECLYCGNPYCLCLRLPDLKTPLFPGNIPGSWYSFLLGARSDVVVEALRYKPDGRGFDSRWHH
jgi:hypothetical protein